MPDLAGYPDPPYKSLPMPRGWEELRMPETGKSLFMDHVNKRTSWIDPRDNHTRHRGPHELPFGWTVDWDATVGVHLMDHINRRAHKIDPRSGKEVAAAGSQARGRLLTAEELLQATAATPSKWQGSVRSHSPGYRATSQSPTSPTSVGSYGAAAVPPGAPEEVSEEGVARSWEEFKDNQLVLRQTRDSLLSLASGRGITAGVALPGGAGHMAAPVQEARRKFIATALYDLENYIHTVNYKSSSLKSALEMQRPATAQHENIPALYAQDHMDQLRGFIDDQHSELANLRLLEYSLADDSGRLLPSHMGQAVFDVLDKRSQQVLQDLLRDEHGRGADDDKRSVYFELLQRALGARTEHTSLIARAHSALPAGFSQF